MRNASPGMALGGEVLGSIAGTSALGKIAGATLGRAIPKLARGGGRWGNLARGVGTDAAYSGIYGGVTGQDALTTTGTGAAASLGGRALGKVAGGALGGLTRSPAAQTLADINIPMTVGQNLGGYAKAAEDRLMSPPGIGDLIRNRRIDSFQALDQALINEAGAPIGATVNEGGERGLNMLKGNIGNAFDSATAGVSVPLDDIFAQEMQALSAKTMPDDYAKAFDDVRRYRVAPAIEGGQLTGDGYQQAMRGLKTAKSKASSVGVSGFEDVYRNQISEAQSILRGQMMRGGGQDVVSGLNNAEQSYRMAKVLEDAQMRAVNGTNTGVPGLPAPSQFNQAAIANLKKFKGQRPFAKTLDAAQQMLPSKIPDSGTAGRLMQVALPAALTGGGAYAGGTEGAASGLAIAALLAAGGTKGGQKALNKMLYARPKSAKAVGALIRKRKGLLGTASIPLALESDK